MRVILASALLLISSLTQAQLPVPVVQALLNEGIPNEQVSVWVQRLDDGKIILSHQAQTARNPASVMKLLISYAALDLLTPSYRWNTQFYSRTVPQGGKINGGLWVRGSGDPSLSDADLNNIASEIKQKWAVQEICCELWLDNSAYQRTSFNPSAFDNKPYRAYNAPAEPLMMNQQSIRVEFPPMGKSVNTVVFPDLAKLNKKFDISLVEEDCSEWKERLQIKREADNLTIKGTYPTECGDKYIDIYWQDGQDYFARGWQLAWLNAIKSATPVSLLPVKSAVLPSDAVLLLEHSSKPLSDIVRDMNKMSNNVMARAVYLALSKTTDANEPASEASAEKVLREWLKNKGWNFPELVLENGSGLSRLERINAEHLGTLLVNAFHSSVMPELMASLPVYGLDGTLKKRKETGLFGKAHLKTGSLEQVRAVAGYMLDAQGRRYAVVWMVNGDRAQRSKSAQEAMLNWIYQQ